MIFQAVFSIDYETETLSISARSSAAALAKARRRAERCARLVPSDCELDYIVNLDDTVIGTGSVQGTGPADGE